ncbi:MAG TPA: Fe-S cluster assembly protein SufB, partial [Myxococcota bacterium]|nr:Fe-S cluster assembly protein SufB [Myxococcota bacterium]
MEAQNPQELVGEYRFGFSDPDRSVYKTRRGLSEETVRDISRIKGEPDWMLAFRLDALRMFRERPMPRWGNSAILDAIDFDNIIYYVRAADRQGRTWDEVPQGIKDTFERLGVPEAERKFLAGVTAQYESEVVYHSIQAEIAKQGVIFTDMDTGLREHGDLVRKYFGTVVPPNDNKFASLNSSVWSGGSFLYVPPGVHVKIPLQAYFRINLRDMGQFERTLIVADEGASVHYIEGCTAPTYASDSLHAAVVEVIALPGSRIRYTTIQNWSKNVLNLVTKRAQAHAGAQVEWVDGNLGSRLTMKYPAIYLVGERAHGEILSIAFAGEGQHQDAGAKVIHAAPDTTSTITSKSISKAGGRASYRGLVKVHPNATGAKVSVKCDALLMDE